MSIRFPWSIEPSPYEQKRAALSAAGVSLLDLCSSNPTQLGLSPPRWLASLKGQEDNAAIYTPNPRGDPQAREAIGRYYERRSISVLADQLLLCASTSEAYSWLFKLLLDPGEAVALPNPSYPLFDFLAHFEGLSPRSYSLQQADDWRADRRELERLLDEGVKAVVIVSPSNPVGARLHPETLHWLGPACAAAGASLIVDEVFLDYQFPGKGDPVVGSVLQETLPCPLYVLSGASKVCALPQLKLSWIVLGDAVARRERERLELLADTYLSVGAAASLALPPLLDDCELAQSPLKSRIRENLALVDEAQRRGTLWSRVSLAAGWSCVLRLPKLPTLAGRGNARPWAECLLEDAQLLVHPGHFYELGVDKVVISLLGPPATIQAGLDRLQQTLRVALES